MFIHNLNDYLNSIMCLLTKVPVFSFVFFGSALMFVAGILAGPYGDMSFVMPVIMVAVAAIWFWSFCFMLIYPFLDD